jgi:hypothetical protein
MKTTVRREKDIAKESQSKMYKEIFENAYKLMNEPIVDGNCGERCGYHCCRHRDANEEKLGMYLLPLEFEYMQSGHVDDFEIHNHRVYDMPPKIKKLHYIHCQKTEGCLRNYRPIQCRTYPFEPHLDDGEFSLVIEKDQLHACPLLDNIPEWRQAFIDGVFNGWLELLKIPMIYYYVSHYSKERIIEKNILKEYSNHTWKGE